MKILIIIGLVTISNIMSQSINGIPISDIDTKYIQIVGSESLFKKTVSISIDYGQHELGKFFQKKGKLVIKNKEDKEIKFNSMVGALNFLNQFGYEFVNAYAITIDNSNVYHYLLKRN